MARSRDAALRKLTMTPSFRLCGALLVLALVHSASSQGLRANFYADQGCPQAEEVIRKMTVAAIFRDVRKAAQLLRLHFHDCFVGGCDGSVLLDSTLDQKAEKDADINFSLAGFEVVDQIKAELERQCPGTVSCADILAVASRASVVQRGGPFFPLRLGRRDGFDSSADATTALPTLVDVDGLMVKFGAHNLTLIDMVALSGGHTIGLSRCVQVQQRLTPFNDGMMNRQFRQTVTNQCFSRTNGSFLSELKLGMDTSSVNTFDNHYFQNLQIRRGLLFSDSVLFRDPRTAPTVQLWARNQKAFFAQFSLSMIKMSEISVLTGGLGEVRFNCRTTNAY